MATTTPSRCRCGALTHTTENCPMPAPRVAHLIDNDDVSLTYCGALLAAPADPGSTEAVRLLSAPDTEYAIWDDVETPGADPTCPTCYVRYLAIYA